MKKFRYFILVLAGVAAMMLGGCKDKEKYDESAFQDDLEPLSEDEVEAMDQNELLFPCIIKAALLIGYAILYRKHTVCIIIVCSSQIGGYMAILINILGHFIFICISAIFIQFLFALRVCCIR